jgi:hypothetical protein
MYAMLALTLQRKHDKNSQMLQINFFLLPSGLGNMVYNLPTVLSGQSVIIGV